MSLRLYLFTLAAVSILLSVACGERADSGAQKPTDKLKVEYFWSAVGNTYGYASIKAGVQAALDDIDKDAKEHPEDFNLFDYVKFEDKEDPESQKKAEELARGIRRDPDVLAVVGNATSGTTFAALPRYAEAGIPVLIASATSPYLLYRRSSGDPIPQIDLAQADFSIPRFANAFRLIPSDVPDQAHAMRLVIREQSKSGKKKVLLICDTKKDSGAEIYSKPFCDYLATPVNRKEGQYDVVARTDIDEREVTSILPEIHATEPDVIVIAGNSALARLVLQVWIEDKEKRSSQPQLSPVFLIPDACLSDELLKFDADLYATYPVSPSRSEKCTSWQGFHAGIACQKQIQLGLQKTACPQRWSAVEVEDKNLPKIPYTDEMFGYDSVLIIQQAAKECVKEHELDRSCILSYLNEHHDALRGICETYHVEHGDRQNAYYFVYHNVKQGNPTVRSWDVEKFATEDDYELHSTASQ